MNGNGDGVCARITLGIHRSKLKLKIGGHGNHRGGESSTAVIAFDEVYRNSTRVCLTPVKLVDRIINPIAFLASQYRIATGSHGDRTVNDSRYAQNLSHGLGLGIILAAHIATTPATTTCPKSRSKRQRDRNAKKT